jgi:hypothetical protein
MLRNPFSFGLVGGCRIEDFGRIGRSSWRYLFSKVLVVRWSLIFPTQHRSLTHNYLSQLPIVNNCELASFVTFLRLHIGSHKWEVFVVLKVYSSSQSQLP